MRPGSARSAWDKAAYAEASRAAAERCAGTPRGGQGGGRAPAAAGRVLVTWRVLASPPASRRVQCARAHPGAAPGARVWRTGRARGRGTPRRGAGDAGGGTAERTVGPARFPEGRGGAEAELAAARAHGDRDAAARLDGNAGASPCSPASCRGARCRPRPRPRPGGTHGGPAPAPRVWGRGLPAPLSRCDRGPSGAAVPGSHLLVSDVINTCRGNRFGKVEEIGCFGKLNLWCL